MKVSFEMACGLIGKRVRLVGRPNPLEGPIVETPTCKIVVVPGEILDCVEVVERLTDVRGTDTGWVLLLTYGGDPTPGDDSISSRIRRVVYDNQIVSLEKFSG